MDTATKRAVCVWVYNPYANKVLAVSRKDDKNDFGLPGGKVDKGENPKFSACRELLEETGYIATDLYSFFYAKTVGGYLAETFLVPGKNELDSWKLFNSFKQQPIDKTVETGVVAWVDPQVLVENSSFSDYNHNLMRSLWNFHYVSFNIDELVNTPYTKKLSHLNIPRSPDFRFSKD